jgi:hypothetical protein
MKEEYTKFLEKVARDYNYPVRKLSFLNPFSNDMFARAVDGALKGLEMVSLATFDFKLTAIVKLLQSWVKDKRDELKKEQIQAQYGSGAWEEYKRNPNDPKWNDPYGNYGFY